MDSKNRIIEQLQRLVPSLTEEVLIAMSNKGTVNRAKKDLGKLRDRISFRLVPAKTNRSAGEWDTLDHKERGFNGMGTTSEVVAELGEDIHVTLRDTVSECSCSCPAVNLCRHIVAAVFYGQEYLADERRDQKSAKIYSEIQGAPLEPEEWNKPNREGAANTEENREEPQGTLPLVSPDTMQELNAMRTEDIKKIVGKKDYVSGILSIRKKPEAEFYYEQMLKVRIASQGVTLYFPKENSIAGSVCSCKKQGMCNHKKYALLSYLITQKNRDLPFEEETAQLDGKQKDLLLQIKQRIAVYMNRGMAGQVPDVTRELERCYIQAYGLKLFALSGELKLLSSYFQEYFDRNVSFSNARTMHLLCRIVNRTDALLHVQGERIRLLAGKKREESLVIHSVRLLGLGAAARLTKRQDMLVSQYFYCPDFHEILVLSTLRPFGQEVNRWSGYGNGAYPAYGYGTASYEEQQRNAALHTCKNYLYTAGIFWGEEVALRDLSGMEILLKNAHLSSGKISGTKKSSCEFKRSLTEGDLEKISISDFSKLKEELRASAYQYFSDYQEGKGLYLIRISRIGEAWYDSVGQKLLVPGYDALGQEITMEMRYHAMTQKAMEQMETSGIKLAYALIRAYEKKGTLWGELLTGFDEKICDFSFW